MNKDVGQWFPAVFSLWGLKTEQSVQRLASLITGCLVMSGSNKDSFFFHFVFAQFEFVFQSKRREYPAILLLWKDNRRTVITFNAALYKGSWPWGWEPVIWFLSSWELILKSCPESAARKKCSRCQRGAGAGETNRNSSVIHQKLFTSCNFHCHTIQHLGPKHWDDR